MAKVTGPLMSMSASGKIADAIVFFSWKGVNVVRQWLKPANPQSTGQGDRRIMIGGTGRSVGKIQPETVFATQLADLGLVIAPQTKQSYLVKYILDHFITGSTSYLAELSACTNHTCYDSFGLAADALDIIEFDLDYATIAPYDKALGLYLIARAAIALNFTGTPYTDNITVWTDAGINDMIADFTTAA